MASCLPTVSLVSTFSLAFLLNSFSLLSTVKNIWNHELSSQKEGTLIYQNPSSNLFRPLGLSKTSLAPGLPRWLSYLYLQFKVGFIWYIFQSINSIDKANFSLFTSSRWCTPQVLSETNLLFEKPWERGCSSSGHNKSTNPQYKKLKQIQWMKLNKRQ